MRQQPRDVADLCNDGRSGWPAEWSGRPAEGSGRPVERVGLAGGAGRAGRSRGSGWPAERVAQAWMWGADKHGCGATETHGCGAPSSDANPSKAATDAPGATRRVGCGAPTTGREPGTALRGSPPCWLHQPQRGQPSTGPIGDDRGVVFTSLRGVNPASWLFRSRHAGFTTGRPAREPFRHRGTGRLGEAHGDHLLGLAGGTSGQRPSGRPSANPGPSTLSFPNRPRRLPPRGSSWSESACWKTE